MELDTGKEFTFEFIGRETGETMFSFKSKCEQSIAELQLDIVKYALESNPLKDISVNTIRPEASYTYGNKIGGIDMYNRGYEPITPKVRETGDKETEPISSEKISFYTLMYEDFFISYYISDEYNGLTETFVDPVENPIMYSFMSEAEGVREWVILNSSNNRFHINPSIRDVFKIKVIMIVIEYNKPEGETKL